MKINIVGTTASGKSTFGRQLAEVINAPFIEMDAIFWGPDWKQSSDEEFNQKLEVALASASWVLDGNYLRSTPVKWREVDTVIWLDYSFSKTLYQSLSRALKRAWFKTELWPGTGNYETFGRMVSKDSIVWWCITNYSKNRARYKSILANPEYSHIDFVHLKSPADAREYIGLQTKLADL